MDTGADITTVPNAVVQQLELMPAREVLAVGYDSAPVRRITYYVRLEVAGHLFQFVEILGSPGTEILIG